ncbi:sigma 54-interacting transcriptional regulator [Clostridium sp. MB40-C1]|nr:sigma 54-interacting transcriptional regulator [Clostridium sp. MB40-C1]WMJ79616.1 sigma 54-interacting transcriptional regulator [Clostridium sp. MB40-C1]
MIYNFKIDKIIYVRYFIYVGVSVINTMGERCSINDFVEKFDVVLKNVKEGIIVLDFKGEIIRVNKRIMEICKEGSEENLKRKILNIYPEIRSGEVFSKGYLIDKCEKHVEINGREVQIRIQPISCKNKDIGTIIFIYEDLNYDKLEKELESNNKYIKDMEAILERAYDGVVAVNKEGIITIISKSYAEYLGVNQKDAIGKHVTEVIDNTRMHRVVKSGKPESTQLQKINDKYIITTRIPIVKNGQVVGAVANVLFRDTRNYNLFYNKINKIEEKFQNKEEKQISEAIYVFDNIVGDSDVIKKTKYLAKKAAGTKSSVLLKGESGTGKELFAHAIHNESKRSSKNFIKVNCAAIPNELLESELFGYEKGSFTGAKTEGKIGKFELADKGTIFLDEIGDMPIHMQAKLLRVIQEREVERIGSNTTKKIDIRIISATNRDLEAMVQEGKFRRDLYYRLNVVEINIPPLRERKEDIIPLVVFLINKLCNKLDKKVNGISIKAMEFLKNYRWEGNIRQLENVLERSINIVEDKEQISPEHLPSNITGMIVNNEKIESLDNIINEAEKHAIVNALIICNGNKTKASKILNISRSTLYEKMNKHRIEI